MNLGFLRSWHAVIALLVVVAFVAWHFIAPMPFGDRADENVWFLLATGWVAVFAFTALALYAARRAAHRLRLSPEFSWEAKLPQLEKAQTLLSDLQNRITSREITGKAAIRKVAREILTNTGVQRVLHIDIKKDARAAGLLRLDVQPRNALGRMSSWLSAHVWYGLAAALLVWFHGGGRCGSTMGMALNALSYFVIGTGMIGALFWAFGPTWLTRAERELTIEKAFSLREHFERKLATATQQLESAPDRRQAALTNVSDLEEQLETAKKAADGTKDKALTKAVKDAQKTLKKAQGEIASIDKESASLPQELNILKGQRLRLRKEAARLGRYQFMLRGWRLLHVPCSVVLLALVAVHVISIYYY